MTATELRYPFPWIPVMEMPETLRELRKDPVVEVTLPSGDTAFLVTRYHDVRALFVDKRLSRNMARLGAARVFANNELLMDRDVDMDTPRLRRLITRAFTTRRVEELRPVAQQITEELLEDMAAGPRPAEFNEALAYPLPIRVISLLLGLPAEDREPLRRRVGGFLSATTLPPGEIARCRQDMGKYVSSLIESKRANPGSDLVSDLIRVRDEHDDRLNEHELHFWVQGLLVAGYINLAYQIGTGTAMLLYHRHLVDEVRQDWSLVPSLVEELLRTQIAGASVGTLRYAIEDIALDGYTIPKGASVLLSVESANVDETVFTDPFTIDVRRGENHHLTFGVGLHYCVGAALARMELQVATEMLLRRFPDIHLAVPAEKLPRSLGEFREGFTKIPVDW